MSSELSNLLNILLPTLASFFSVVWVYFKVLRIAKAKNLVDNPDARKLQKEPVPVLGGLAVFIGVLGGLAMATCFIDITSLFPIVLMMGIMLYLGTLDDLQGLKPVTRLIIETLAILVLIFSSNTCIDNLHGIWGIYQITHWVAVPLTVFAGVGIINSINMIDGVNGLSSGICIMVSLFFGIVFFGSGVPNPNIILAFVMAAALIPFLLHNVFGMTSRMFIGDAGTMVMGILITWFVIQKLGTQGTTQIPFLPGNEDPHNFRYPHSDACFVPQVLSILVVPIFDTLRVMTMRVLHGQSPFHADKTHLHHAFIACGFSHSITSLTEVCLCVVAYAISYASRNLGFSPTNQLYVVLLSGVLLVWGLYVWLNYRSKHATATSRYLSQKSHLGHFRWWKRFQHYLDAPEHLEQFPASRQNDRLNRKFRN